MIKRFLFIIAVFLLGFGGLVKAQDAHFSQFYANPLYLNPAFAGSDKCPRVNMSYRNQWPALGQTYVTYSLSYDQHVRLIQGGVGLLLTHDTQGDGSIVSTSISGMYSYTLPVTRKFAITGGFQASYMMKTIKWDYIFPDMIHPLYGPIYATQEDPSIVDTQRDYFDFSTGVIGFTENIFFGVAVHHLTQPSESFLQGSDAVLPRKYTLHFGMDIPMTFGNMKRGDLSIAPQALFQQQGDFQQFNWGVYVNRKSIIAGFWARQNFNFHYDSFIMLIGFKQDNIKFGYSYDLTISKLWNSTLGAHEVSLGFTFACRPPRTTLRTINCPRM